MRVAPLEDFPAAGWDKVLDLNPLLESSGDEMAASSPLGRIGRADDMAGAAVYLSSRAGAWITGVILPVDGGIWTTL